MEYEHEITLKATGLKHEELPRSLKAKINRFNQMRTALGSNPDTKKQRDISVYSAVVADEVLDFFEKDFPETIERILSPEEKANRVKEYERARAKLKQEG